VFYFYCPTYLHGVSTVGMYKNEIYMKFEGKYDVEGKGDILELSSGM